MFAEAMLRETIEQHRTGIFVSYITLSFLPDHYEQLTKHKHSKSMLMADSLLMILFGSLLYLIFGTDFTLEPTQLILVLSHLCLHKYQFTSLLNMKEK